MKTTGNDLIAAIEMYELDLETLKGEFSESLFKKENETKRNPSEISKELLEVEAKIASLQAAQAKLNTLVQVVVAGYSLQEKMSLSQAIKTKGCFDRAIPRWTSAMNQDKDPSRSYLDTEQEKSERTTTRKSCAAELAKLKMLNRAFQGAISSGNRVQIDVQDLSCERLPELLKVLETALA